MLKTVRLASTFQLYHAGHHAELHIDLLRHKVKVLSISP